ncbi:hypothetical protein LQE88_11575 [Acidaminococcus sp. NSJ-142]|jgi:hypothetical protein|uniref:hypothetical protein n=1 Tax=Acidaminococcus TaxID=904 RepID=UPI000E4C6F4B|nr:MULTISPECIES: hypothetical protein [Acidaminococcus]MCD2436613.1 hypothetical protein [Acidaminococcus hominis]RHK00935.1 hypothetical protein DW089_08845 [Acidaminococcus sp. AM05-11]
MAEICHPTIKREEPLLTILLLGFTLFNILELLMGFIGKVLGIGKIAVNGKSCSPIQFIMQNPVIIANFIFVILLFFVWMAGMTQFLGPGTF